MLSALWSTLRPALLLTLTLTAHCGLIYPLSITVLSRLLLPDLANGSLLRVDGEVRGAALVGQPFDDPGHFWSRPSATATPYDPAASSGSNLGPSNPTLHTAVAARHAALRAAHPTAGAPPAELLLASGSGLDPHLSPAAARYQRDRVAAARACSPAAVDALITAHTAPRALGIFGEARVNVLQLNLALATACPAPAAGGR
jgi:K+-transporting ATPase ATPase C chain